MAVTAVPAASCAGLTGSASAASQLSRSLERLLEEAALSGELRLSGRKLRELPRRARELRDTVRADLSKNRLSELPDEVTTYVYMERLLLAHNCIRQLPDTVSCLQSLTYLDLSGNQLTEVPREVCLLAPLQVLLLSGNRLSALPKEIGKLSALAELDAARNRLAHVPLSIGELQSLRALDLSNNQLPLLPLQITYLKLETLDVSCNCISSLPLELRHMSSLVTLLLDNNPLVSPPTTVCMRGRVHIFKYLESLESKECAAPRGDSRRAAAAKHSSYVAPAPTPASTTHTHAGNATLDCVRHRAPRHVDSGYSTSDADKRCSGDVLGEGVGAASALDGAASSGRSTPSTPSTLSPGAALSRAHSLSSESPLAGLRISPEGHLANGDDKTKLSHQQTYRQYKEALRQQRQQDVYRPRSDQPSPSPDADSPHGGSPAHKLSHSTPHSPVANGHHLAGYRPASSTPNTCQLPGSPLLHSTPRRPHAPAGPQAPVNGNTLPDSGYKTEENKRPVQKVVPSRNVNKMNLSNGNVEYQNGRIPGSGSLPRMRTAVSPDGDAYIKPVSPTKSPTLGVAPARLGIAARSDDAKLLTASVSYLKGASAKPPGPSGRLAWSKDVPPDKLSFTMKREFDKQKEELDLLQQLRTIIESRLKMSLPEELAPVLADGVVLCHLANHVRPRSVASVHVPSVAQPKLTMARCRRNVDNFLEACRKIGVEEEEICSADDVLCHREAPLARTLAALLAHATPSPAHRPRRAPPHPHAQLHVHTELGDEGARECRIDYFQRRHRCTDERIISNFNSCGDRADYSIDEADEYQLHLQNNNDHFSHARAYKEAARSDQDPYALGYNGETYRHVQFNEETYEQVQFNGDTYEQSTYSGNTHEQNLINGDEPSQFIGEQKSSGDKLRNRVHFVAPYLNGGGGRDEVDSARRYVRGSMSLHIQHNLNACLEKPTDSDIAQAAPARAADPAPDNTLVTFLCLGGFLLTALLLYLVPLQ